MRNVAGGDVYAFPKLVNHAYTHQVCQAEESTNDEDIRLSIIIWGRAKKLEEPATTSLTLADICKEMPNLFEVVETINFGAESVEFSWDETYSLEYWLEEKVGHMINGIINLEIGDLPEKYASITNDIDFWDEVDVSGQLTRLRQIIRICKLYLREVTSDQNYLIVQSSLSDSDFPGFSAYNTANTYVYAYCSCKHPKKLRKWY